MKNMAKFLGSLILLLGLLNISCRSEEFESVGSLPEESLQSDSKVAKLLVRTSMKDGSPDNILDMASCFSIKLPATVIVNGTELTVETEEDLDEIELIFEESDEDTDTLEIIFPVTIVYADYTEAVAMNADELADFSASCPEENGSDEDIECIDIVYPISISIFNPNTEVFDTVSLENDEMLNDFIADLDEDDIVNIEFPITLVLSDDSEMEVSDLEELESLIESFKDDCDEDDDNDFFDDNCTDCTVEQLQEAFAECADFKVNKFSLDGQNLKSQYDDLSFDFQEDGNLSATSNTESFMGTWSASGSGNDIILSIEIPDLSDFTSEWPLNRILKNPGITKITLRQDEDNVLRFQDSCKK